jgi:hypothetical protein
VLKPKIAVAEEKTLEQVGSGRKETIGREFKADLWVLRLRTLNGISHRKAYKQSIGIWVL